MKNRKLTGKFYHKKTWCGLVLYVEITFNKYINNGGYITSEEDICYVKASEADAKELKLS